MRKSRTEIAIELDQVITITRRPPLVSDWCATCESKVLMVTLEEASALISISVLAIDRLIQAHLVHFTETNTGVIRLCLPTLLQARPTRVPDLTTIQQAYKTEVNTE
jgi:hypothetical protein